MTAGAASKVALSEAMLHRLRTTLDAHDVELGILFGSAARPEGDPADVDLAVSFGPHQPSDEGYASVYLDLRGDLESDLGTQVDLVDVHSMQPRFARVVFDDGVLVVGTPERREALAEIVADAEPSLEDARERIGAAARRLREQSS